MVKIVNGVIVGDQQAGSSSSSSSSSWLSFNNTVLIFGQNIRLMYMYIFFFLTLVLLGFQGFILVALVAGLGYFYSNQQQSGNSNSSDLESGAALIPRGGNKATPGLARVHGMKDLPPDP